MSGITWHRALRRKRNIKFFSPLIPNVAGITRNKIYFTKWKMPIGSWHFTFQNTAPSTEEKFCSITSPPHTLEDFYQSFRIPLCFKVGGVHMWGAHSQSVGIRSHQCFFLHFCNVACGVHICTACFAKLANI
jgi:hypothetical protein